MLGRRLNLAFVAWFVALMLLALFLQIFDDGASFAYVFYLFNRTHVISLMATCTLYAVLVLIDATFYYTERHVKHALLPSAEERSSKAMFMQKRFVIAFIFCSIATLLAVKLNDFGGDFLLIQSHLAVVASIGNSILLEA